MSTSSDTVIYLSDQLATLSSRIRTRKMFGEYALYCDERVVGLICDDQVFIKITEQGKTFLGSSYQESLPYPGAKPYMLIGGDIIEDKESFVKLVEISAKNIPLPKPKKPKIKQWKYRLLPKPNLA